MTNRGILGMCLLLAGLLSPEAGAQAQQEEYNKRAPFVIQLPEVGLDWKADEKVEIVHPPDFPTQTSLRTIRFKALNPYAESFLYSRILTFINDKPANIAIKSKRPVQDGIVVELDLSLLREFQLAPDRNVLEITALDAKRREYRAAFVLLSTGKAEATTFLGRKLAVIIGISDYKFNDERWGDLSYADDDAISIQQFLLSPAGGGFAKENIEILTDANAGLVTVRDRLKRFLGKAERQDLVFFFLAGHGFLDPYKPDDLYFAMHDTKLADLPRTALPMSELREILKGQKAERIIGFIDTCHSAGIALQAAQSTKKPAAEQRSPVGTAKGRRGKVPPGSKPVAQHASSADTEKGRGVKVTPGSAPAPASRPSEAKPQAAEIPAYAAKNFLEKGWAVLVSSDANESSLEGARWDNGHGLFTYAILRGLGGEADSDRDGMVSTAELFNFVQQCVASESNGRQNPRALPGNEKIVLATVAVAPPK